MSELLKSYFALNERILTATELSGRDHSCVQLLAVSKRQPALRVRELYQLGQLAFGESYLQEAIQKMDELSDLSIQWHFIGPLQSNKTRQLAARFDWVQSVDSEKLLIRLSEQRPEELSPLNILLQVNIDSESQKRGINPSQLEALAKQAIRLKGIRLRGLMTIPKPGKSRAEQERSFAKVAALMQQIKPLSAKIDTLSMGMSADIETAIASGSTMVRVGSLLFGSRGE